MAENVYKLGKYAEGFIDIDGTPAIRYYGISGLVLRMPELEPHELSKYAKFLEDRKRAKDFPEDYECTCAVVLVSGNDKCRNCGGTI